MWPPSSGSFAATSLQGNQPTGNGQRPRPPIRDIFMRLYDSRSRDGQDGSKDFLQEVILEQNIDIGPYPLPRFPSLTPRHKRNSAKRRKRDKSIPAHLMTTLTVQLQPTFTKLPRWRQQQYDAGMHTNLRRRSLSDDGTGSISGEAGSRKRGVHSNGVDSHRATATVSIDGDEGSDDSELSSDDDRGDDDEDDNGEDVNDGNGEESGVD